MTSSKQESLEELVVRKVQEYLAKHLENPWKKDNEKERAFHQLQEELVKTRDACNVLRDDRDVYAAHAGGLQGELVHARELLTEQGKTLARLKDQVEALQEHASRVYWLGQENGLDQAETLISQVSSEGISQGKVANVVHTIDGWRNQALDNAERKKSMPTITQAVEADRMEKEKADKESVSDSPAPAYRPTPEEAAELKKVTNAIGAAAASALHTLLCGPTKKVQIESVVESFPCPRCGAGLYDSTQIPFTCGWCHTLVEAPAGLSSSSASTAGDPEVLKAGLTSARKDLFAVRQEVDVLRDERDFLSWSMIRMAKIVREFWFALSFEETCHPRGLSSDVARDRLVVLSHKPMRRDSDGRLIINWENVLDSAHYGGTVSVGMKHWLDSLWMTT